MYAVIETGGKQHRVSIGETLAIEKLEQKIGDKVDFDQILMVSDDKNVRIGQPYVEGAKVSAEVVEQGRNKKVSIIKFKRRKHQMKHQGHRQYYTKIKILDIQTK